MYEIAYEFEPYEFLYKCKNGRNKSSCKGRSSELAEELKRGACELTMVSLKNDATAKKWVDIWNRNACFYTLERSEKLKSGASLWCEYFVLKGHGVLQ